MVKQTAGYFGTRRNLFRRANEAWMKAMTYAYRDRRNRRREMRRLWIQRINAAARIHGTTYSQLMHCLSAANIDLDRKMLADMAVNDPQVFERVVQTALQA
jgi:large subunit ribosomal protein L20